jgi:hypothetical protein
MGITLRDKLPLYRMIISALLVILFPLLHHLWSAYAVLYLTHYQILSDAATIAPVQWTRSVAKGISPDFRRRKEQCRVEPIGLLIPEALEVL